MGIMSAPYFETSPKTIAIASAGVALVLAATCVWLLNRPPTASCGAEAPADQRGYKIQATKVVVRPWLGQHQVYGIFLVPSRYQDNKEYTVTMNVRGFNQYFTVYERSIKENVDDVFAKAGHYLMRSYVPTRVALWFLINGQFGDLRHPCNWTLLFNERSP